MATRRTTSKLTKTAFAAINAASAPPKRSSAAAGAARALSRSRSLSGSVLGFGNSVHPLTCPPPRGANVLASSVSAGAVELRGVAGFGSRGSGLPSRAYSTAASASQTNPSEFTEMAWESIIGPVDAARVCKQQVVETEHLMKALLEQKDGLARRILTKAGLHNTSVLQAVDNFCPNNQRLCEILVAL